MQTPSTLSYIDSGSGLPLLLGHSYLFDKTMWSPQMTALAKQFRVIVPDLWGHGESPALPAGKSSMADLAADHLQIMDALGIEEFAIVGLSVGGMWGAELAAMAPERVKALMLIDTFIGSETDEAREKYFAMLNAIDAAGTLPRRCWSMWFRSSTRIMPIHLMFRRSRPGLVHSAQSSCARALFRLASSFSGGPIVWRCWRKSVARCRLPPESWIYRARRWRAN
ncbi:alpha/beta fold hydrolase [Kosakonia cowanii]|uniref:alpha/beta fold hydrolase n=1 Tax=Kosakonia cowanii TaxID=208223 RepID=UPI001CEF65E1|nr:alpha/beta fold hydrolase [Kosakonia cowanii]